MLKLKRTIFFYVKLGRNICSFSDVNLLFKASALVCGTPTFLCLPPVLVKWELGLVVPVHRESF